MPEPDVGATPDLDTPAAPPIPVACQMSGGPSDGTHYEFGYLPVALGVRWPVKGFYQRTEETTADGARIFAFRPFGD